MHLSDGARGTPPSPITSCRFREVICDLSCAGISEIGKAILSGLSECPGGVTFECTERRDLEPTTEFLPIADILDHPKGQGQGVGARAGDLKYIPEFKRAATLLFRASKWPKACRLGVVIFQPRGPFSATPDAMASQDGLLAASLNHCCAS